LVKNSTDVKGRIRNCYELQINNSKSESWTKKFKEELSEVGSEYI
jgi:hypothetical protein